MNIDNENDAFWSELSETRAASKLGIAPSDPDSHVVFDKWFFGTTRIWRILRLFRGRILEINAFWKLVLVMDPLEGGQFSTGLFTRGLMFRKVQ